MYKQIVKYLSHASISFAIGSILSTIIFITLIRSGFLHSYDPITGDYALYFKFGTFVADFFVLSLIIYSMAPLLSLIGLFIAWRKPILKLSSINTIFLAIFIVACSMLIFWVCFGAIGMAAGFTSGDINPN